MKKTKRHLLQSIGAGFPFKSLRAGKDNVKAYKEVEVFTISSPKAGYTYFLIDGDTRELHDKQPGGGAVLELRSFPLVKLTTTLCIEEEKDDCPGNRELCRKVTIKTKLNSHVQVSVAKSTIAYGQRALVRLQGVQKEALYQLVDNEGLVLSPMLTGDNEGTLEIETYSLYDSTDINVQVKEPVSGQTTFLNQSPFIRVGPHLKLNVSANESSVTLGKSFILSIEQSQIGVTYQAVYERIDDVLIQDLHLDLMCSEKVQGNGGLLPITCKPSYTGSIAVYAQWRDFLNEKLTQRVQMKVTPPTDAQVRAVSEWIPYNTAAVIGVSPIIENMEYRLLDIHSGRVLDTIKNIPAKEIGEGRVEIDFMVYKFIDDEIELKTPPLTENSEFCVEISNIRTGMKDVLKQKVYIQVGGESAGQQIPLHQGAVSYAKR